ncbi:unnamed protein product [Sphagnum balticum]
MPPRFAYGLKAWVQNVHALPTHGLTTSDPTTNLSYSICYISCSTPTAHIGTNMSMRPEIAAYIYDAYYASSDPLIRIVAETPVDRDYKLPSPYQKQHSVGFMWTSQAYISFQHVELLTLLHKLGLRGYSRYKY